MAYGIENFPNITPANADYPKGAIKDDTGANDGTPVNKLVYDDVHQTHMKILLLAGITANNLPDNVTNGYQYVQALQKLFKNYIGIAGNSVSTAFTVSDINKLIITGGSGSPVNTLPSSSTLQDGDCITFLNVGSGTFTVLEAVGDSIANNPGVFKPNDYVRLVLAKSLNLWFVVDYRQTVTPAIPAYVYNQISHIFPSGTSHILVYQTPISGVSALYNTTTGRFTPTEAGLYQIDWTAVCTSFGGYGAQMLLGSSLLKNGVQVGFITDRKDLRTDSDWITTSGSVTIEANGTTDYFEIQLYNGSSLQKTVYGNFFAKKVG